MTLWQPDSWRTRPATQLPSYPDQKALLTAESCLASAPPIVEVADIKALKRLLGTVAEGRGFLLQGGDCAESFTEFGADKVRLSFNLLLAMAEIVRERSGLSVVKVGRIAGQFAKPRSSPVEQVGNFCLPAYRGDIVNGAAANPASRTPDPMRMLEAYRQAQATIHLLRAFSAAAYVDLSKIHRQPPQRIERAFDRQTQAESVDRPIDFFTSHEALLLPYEQALTRWDATTRQWWCRSAHIVWIGDRTRDLDGAHVEFARGVANPVGLKCGPSMTPDELLNLIERLDPANKPGKIILIGRFGADRIEPCLPRLMKAVARAGRRAIWTIDPMHGNTKTLSGQKTRFIADILREVHSFFAIARAERVHSGGVHLELTGGDVTECVGGRTALGEADLASRYHTHCDPRLNANQALEIAEEVAGLLTPAVSARSDAA